MTEEAKKEEIIQANSPVSTMLKDEKTTAEEKGKHGKVSGFPEVRPGMWIRIHQKIKEMNTKGEEKERIQIFEGRVIARKGGTEQGATITVHKESFGVGVEKIFPVHMPTIEKIEILKKAKIRRAKLRYLLRGYKKKIKEEKIVE